MTDKYRKAKDAAKIWYSKYEDSLQVIMDLEKENKSLQEDVKKWKTFSEELPDPESEKELKKLVKSLKKQISEMEEKYKEKIANLEKDKILLDAKIQRLEDSKADLKERYNDLKSDYQKIKT